MQTDEPIGRGGGRRSLGQTGLTVSPIIAGTGRWYERPDRVSPTRRETFDLVKAIHSDGIVTTLDTSNNYGLGESETRIGLAFAELGIDRDALLVQTKADRSYDDSDFSGARMRRSLEESMERLGVDFLPMVYLHDPAHTTWEQAMADGGPVAELVAARTEGLIGALGVAGSPVELMLRFVNTGIFEAVITHNRYTLVDQTAEPLIAAAHARGVGVTNAAPYGGGLLTAWPPTTTIYAYRQASDRVLSQAEQIAQLCRDADLPLGMVALHWSLQDPRLSATIVGFERVQDYRLTMEWYRNEIPDDLWDAIREVHQADLDQAAVS